MNFFKKTRIDWHHRQLEQLVKTRKTKHQSTAFKHIKSVGVLFDASNLKEREEALRFVKELKDSGKKVRVMAFLNEKEKIDNLPFVHFSQKEVDFFYRPKSTETQEFISKDFDVLLNLSPTNNIHLEYIAALSRAHYRVGAATTKMYCYELMIDSQPSTSVKNYIKQISFFLNKMHSSRAGNIPA